MCLRVTLASKHRSSKPLSEKVKLSYMRIASEDITVYKVVIKIDKGHYQSLYQMYEYKDGEHHYQTGDKFGTIDDSYYELMITTGLHSYTSLEVAHASLEIVQCKSYHYRYLKIIECIIPKGSQYFKGIYKEYCSDNLIIIGEVDARRRKN